MGNAAKEFTLKLSNRTMEYIYTVLNDETGSQLEGKRTLYKAIIRLQNYTDHNAIFSSGRLVGYRNEKGHVVPGFQASQYEINLINEVAERS